MAGGSYGPMTSSCGKKGTETGYVYGLAGCCAIAVLILAIRSYSVKSALIAALIKICITLIN
jgi:hypothetical protein